VGKASTLRHEIGDFGLKRIDRKVTATARQADGQKQVVESTARQVDDLKQVVESTARQVGEIKVMLQTAIGQMAIANSSSAATVVDA
jgi:hypothetical protein